MNNDGTSIDRTTLSLVNRDYGDKSKASDWFKECGLDRFGSESIDFIGLFIDVSGSMGFDTVQESAKKFVNEMDCAGISVDLVFNDDERWLDPFFTSLKPPEGTSECDVYKDLCSSGVCRDGLCMALDQPLGSNCSKYDELCASNACVEGICSHEYEKPTHLFISSVRIYKLLL